MAPRPWPKRSKADPGRDAVPAVDSPDPQGPWHRAGTVRRLTLALVLAVQTWFATDLMTTVLPYHGTRWLEIAVLSLFAILFLWVSTGFWMAITGFLLTVSGRDRYNIANTVKDDAPIDPQARTAIIMPICNEDVARVFAGLRATYDSLARTGELRHFDFFVLSDSNDPDARVAERDAWLQMCRSVGGFGHVFYRWRQHRIKRKSGNVADFCRRWGSNYRYMVVLDADSVMTGACLTKLVRIMEANPSAGIVQTAPRAAGHTTMYARIQQFATRVYGPVFVAGLHFFQLGEAHYWGHNAILRVAPFMRHCALARLPGKGAMSGEILSHDFVEAALMRRAGWAVWIAYDLEGSYEEMPPNLIDELKRDRRWCQGNLINVRLSTARGLHPAHRAVFMMGVMAYCSAPLWFTFLMLSTVLLGVHTLVEPEYFTRSEQLFPVWPEWHPQRGMTLYAATAILLFLPKILGVALFVLQGARHFGGRLRLMASMAVEFAFSALLAPIRMLFHTHFVLSTFAGLKIQWKSPPREDTETQWSEALRHHGLHSLFGLIWAGVVYWLNPSFLLWLLPVVGALMLSVPLSVLSSRVTMGRRLQRLGLFVIPEEELPPRELVETRARAAQTPEPPGFQDAIVDPAVNDLMRGALLRRRRNTPMDQKRRSELVPLALREGPDALSAKDKSALLLDPIALDALHRQLKTATGGVHRRWFERRPTAEVGGAAA